MTTKWNGKIHELAAMFPRLDAESFALLVESIRQNGMREPITIDGNGTLLDGINRATAAQEVGIDPPIFIEHGDPIAFIRDANLRRRHLNLGQQGLLDGLLLVAEGKRIYDKNGDGRWEDGAVKITAVGNDYTMKRVGAIIDHAPDLISGVINGTEDFGVVYKQAATNRKEKRKAKGQSVGIAKQMFNHTNENIGWAAWSWNPVTGCKHDCPYCYARDIAENFQRRGVDGYDDGFEPAFHQRRLLAPVNTKFLSDPNLDERERRVFVCSMADLFGRWVPQDWIDQVFEAANKAPDWQYLWLTKFPNRYKKLNFPPNSWAGTSVDTQKRVVTAMQSMAQVDAKIRWLSCEPLLEPLKFDDLSMFNLVVIGAQTAIGKTKSFPAQEAIAPDFNWVMDLVAQARRDGCAVYLKENLIGDRDDQAPGMVLPQELPS